MIQRITQTLWGNFKGKEEWLKFLRLAGIFAFTLAVYYMLNPTKDVVFLKIVGRGYFPYARVFTLLILIPILTIYSKLVDRYERHKVFYVLTAIYSIACLIGATLISNPVIGIANTVSSPWRLLGWSWYAFVESFISLMVVLFWTFAADTSTPDSAKRGFPIIALGAQLGSVLGALTFLPFGEAYGPGFVAFCAAAGIAFIGVLVFYFMRVTPESELRGYHGEVQSAVHKKPATTFLEGVRLLLSAPYLMGIAIIVGLGDIIFIVLEMQLKILADMTYEGTNLLTAFFFKYYIYTNLVALLSLLFGVNAIGRKLGLKAALLVLPILMAMAIAVSWVYPQLGVLLVVLIVIKGLNFALNQPAKEQLYIPTSKDSKYKAKAWIDVFGSRLAKGAGSSVHMLRPVLHSYFVMVSSVACLGLIGVWIAAALFVGRKHADAIRDGETLC